MNIEDLKPNESLEYLSDEQLREIEIKGGHPANDMGEHHGLTPEEYQLFCLLPELYGQNPGHLYCYHL